MRFTPNGPAVIDRVIRMSSRNRSGGTIAAPRVPMPPALETAATSGGVVTKPIPAPINGTSSPYASVKRVRNIFYPLKFAFTGWFLSFSTRSEHAQHFTCQMHKRIIPTCDTAGEISPSLCKGGGLNPAPSPPSGEGGGEAPPLLARHQYQHARIHPFGALL